MGMHIHTISVYKSVSMSLIEQKKKKKLPRNCEHSRLSTPNASSWLVHVIYVELSPRSVTMRGISSKRIHSLDEKKTGTLVDFKYWDDPSDEFRDNEGTLLPLWKFSFDKVKKMANTALSWNPKYQDLFVSAYGSCKWPKATPVCFLQWTNSRKPQTEVLSEFIVFSWSIVEDFKGSLPNWFLGATDIHPDGVVPCLANKDEVLCASDDFTKQTSGMLLFHSLKNPSYPDYIFETKSGILCLDVHPEHPHLVCVGFYDGAVAVFSVTESLKRPVYQSTAKTGTWLHKLQLQWSTAHSLFCPALSILEHFVTFKKTDQCHSQTEFVYTLVSLMGLVRKFNAETKFSRVQSASKEANWKFQWLWSSCRQAHWPGLAGQVAERRLGQQPQLLLSVLWWPGGVLDSCEGLRSCLTTILPIKTFSLVKSSFIHSFHANTRQCTLQS